MFVVPIFHCLRLFHGVQGYGFSFVYLSRKSRNFSREKCVKRLFWRGRAGRGPCRSTLGIRDDRNVFFSLMRRTMWCTARVLKICRTRFCFGIIGIRIYFWFSITCHEIWFHHSIVCSHISNFWNSVQYSVELDCNSGFVYWRDTNGSHILIQDEGDWKNYPAVSTRIRTHTYSQVVPTGHVNQKSDDV